MAYWVSEKIFHIYQNYPILDSFAEVKHGLTTGKNELFVRAWTEVEREKIDTTLTDRSQITSKSRRYVPYNKGGEYRLWYGNADYVLWYDLNGQKQMAQFSGHRHDGKDMYFHEGITWSFISSSNFGVRYTPSGFAFDVAGSSMFFDNEYLMYVCGLLCSRIGSQFMSIQNPTLAFQVGNLKDIPVVINQKETVEDVVKKNIAMSKNDWDSFETSWDFKKHPLI